MEQKLKRALQLYVEAVGKTEGEVINRAVREYLYHHYTEVGDKATRSKILRLLKGEDEEPTLTFNGVKIPLIKASELLRDILREQGGVAKYYDVMKVLLGRLGVELDFPREISFLKDLHSAFFMVETSITSLRGYIVFKSNGEFSALANVYIVGVLEKSQLNKGFYPILKFSYLILADNEWDLVKKALPLLKSLQDELRTEV